MRALIVLLQFGVAVGMAGCTTANPLYCDEDQPCTDPEAMFCDISGEFGDRNTCVATPVSDGGLGSDGAPSGPDATLGDPDAASSDAGGEVAYEVAYGNVFTFILPDLVVNDWLIVINTGDVPLDMDTIVVRSVSDDHPSATIAVAANPHTASVGPGFAGGYLGMAYTDPVINSGMVPEPRTDFEGGGANAILRMWLEPEGAPGGTYDVRADVTMSINDVEKDLSILIHVDPSGVHTATGFTRE